MLKDSIYNGLYEMKTITNPGIPTSNPSVQPYQRLQTKEDLISDDKKGFEANIDTMNAMLLDKPNDIYNSVDACQTAQAMWKHVRRLMQGTDLNKHEMTSELLMNITTLPNILATNIKFLNSLQSEWSKYVTMVRQLKNLYEADYDQLYDYLRQNENNVNALRAKGSSRTHDPLNLVANHYVIPPSLHISPTYYVDNRLRAFSNIRNQAYVQDGRIDVQSKNIGNAGRVARNSIYSRNT
ncbi:hypothetical protein Tco_0502866 [Tanacetum coccineum]